MVCLEFGLAGEASLKVRSGAYSAEEAGNAGKETAVEAAAEAAAGTVTETGAADTEAVYSAA